MPAHDLLNFVFLQSLETPSYQSVSEFLNIMLIIAFFSFRHYQLSVKKSEGFGAGVSLPRGSQCGESTAVGAAIRADLI